MRQPRGLLFDYGGTLVEEVAFNTNAGIEWLLTQATTKPTAASRDRVRDRADRVSREVASRRDLFQVETPWPSLTRLIHDFCGTQFTQPLAALELGFWDAAVTTRPMPGAGEALGEFQRLGIPMGVVSNSSFGQATIRHELAKHGLAECLTVLVVSAEYAVRKPNPLLFDAAAALLDIPCADVWFVGDRMDTDVVGARAAGMTGILLSPSTVADSSNEEFVVRGWPDVLAMLRQTIA
jgi:putative hydrolase of the HAD superfamily